MGTSYDPGRLLPWVPEAFHARFPLSVKAFKKVTRAKHVSAGGRRNGAPRRTWEKTSGTQGRRLSATQPFLVSSHDAPFGVTTLKTALKQTTLDTDRTWKKCATYEYSSFISAQILQKSPQNPNSLTADRLLKCFHPNFRVSEDFVGLSVF